MRSGGGVFWTGAEAVASAALSFLSVFVVARLIGPAELGIGAAAVASHVLLWVAANALFADALVQRAALTSAELAASRRAAAACGLAAGAAQALLGWPLVWSLHDPRLLPMALLLALPLPLVGAGGAAQGMLTRDRRYRALALRALVGQGLGTLAGIGAAEAGAGAWALVLQQATVSAAGAATLLLAARGPRNDVRWRWRDAGPLLATGLPLTAATLVQSSRYRLFALMIGGTAGPLALGQVHMAFRLSDTLRDLMLSALWRLLLPAMSRRQHDLRALQAYLDRALALSGLVVFPVCATLLTIVQPAVALLLGPGFAPSGTAAMWLAGLMAYVMLGFPGGVANIARGFAQASLASQIAGTALTLILVALVRPRTPLGAVLVWGAVQAATSPIAMWVTARAMGASMTRHFRAGWSPLGLAALSAAAAFALPEALGPPRDPAALIAARLACGALVYLPGAWLLLRGSVRAALLSAGISAVPEATP